jgi:hypothetical protein
MPVQCSVIRDVGIKEYVKYLQGTDFSLPQPDISCVVKKFNTFMALADSSPPPPVTPLMRQMNRVHF